MIRRCPANGAAFLLFILLLGTPGASRGAQIDTAASLSELEARAQRDSNDAGVHYRLALRYWEKKRYDDEEAALRRAVSVDPRYAPAFLALGDLPFDRRPKLREEELKGKVPEAWRAPLERSYRLWRKAFLIDPLVDFRVIGYQPPPEKYITLPDYGDLTTQVLGWLGVRAFGAAHYELAYDALNRYAERQYAGQPPDSIPDFLLWYRGLAAAHLTHHTLAIADFQMLLDRELRHEHADTLIQIPLNTNDYRYVLAVMKERASKPADAVTLYKEAIANDLGLYMAHVRLARLYQSYKMWDDAIREANRAVEASPDDPSLLYDLGDIERDAGRLAEAEATLHRAMEANPRDARVVYLAGRVAQDLGKAAEARAAWQRFLAIAPSRYTEMIADARARLALAP